MEIIDNTYEGPVFSVAEVVEIEQEASKGGTSLLELMKRAGAAVSEVAQSMVASRGDSIVILAGSGNNGGDGWVAADDLANAGFAVTLVTKQSAEDLTTEPARTAAIASEREGRFSVLVNPSQDELAKLMQNADLIIDAILGTGFAYDEVRVPYDKWINLANDAHSKGAKLLAVDCPSGLNAQTGTPANACICADATVTMIAVKRGLIQGSANRHVGKLFLSDLGIENSSTEKGE